jgi:hypothetical protein
MPGVPEMEQYDAPPGPRSTRDILELLHGAGIGDAGIAHVLTPFPVIGPAAYSNDWHHPRTEPEPHLHEGCDIFAARGTPIIAVAQGRVSNLQINQGAGGTTLRLTTPDGTYFYYAHLDAFAPFLYDGTLVPQGEVLGYVGNTGDADGGPTHLHFEVHPNGGPAVPPVPYLDRWLADSLAGARELAGVDTSASHEIPLLSAGADAATAVVNSARNVVSRAAATTVPNSLSPVDPLFGMAVVAAIVWLVSRRRRTQAELQLRLERAKGANVTSIKEDP